MAGDYPENYGRNNFRPHNDSDRSHHEEEGFFDRIGNKLHQGWDRMTGEADERRGGSGNAPYGTGASGDYSRGSRYGGGAGQSGGGSGYGESQMGRYIPQRASGGGYGESGPYRSDRNSSTGYSARMSDYRGASQRGNHEGGERPYGASGQAYGAYGDPYNSGSSRGYGDAADQGAPSGGYGRSSMGFPRGSDYGSGGSGSMGGGYFGSGAGPWSGGPYSDTGSGGYTQQRNQDRTSDSDYQYSRREQRRRGESDQGYGSPYDR
jgi:hypothetical protein